MGIDEVVRPLVVMKQPNIFNRFYRVVLYINRLKKKYREEGAGKATNEYVIFELKELIQHRAVKERFNADKGNWWYWVIENLDYAIRDRFRALDSQSLKEYKTYLKYGEVSDESLIEDMDIIGTYDRSDSLDIYELVKDVEEYIGKDVFELQSRGFKPAEIAHRLGYTPEYFAVKMYRKRRGLMKYLLDKGYKIEDIPEFILKKLGGSNGRSKSFERTNK